MSELDQIVQLQLTRGSTPVETASFQIPGILATFTNFSERTRTYTDIDGVGEDFRTTDPVYILASKLFGQSTVGAVPPSIVVGRRQVNTVNGSVTVQNSTPYTVTINGTTYSFTSDVSATAIEIIAGLDTAVGTSPVGVTFTDNLDGTFTVGPTVAGTPWSFRASPNVTLANSTPTESYADAEVAMNEDNGTWYALFPDTHEEADVIALSNVIVAQRKIMGTSSQDPAVITSGTTDIAALLSLASAGRTYGVYLPTADTEYPEAAWAGSQLAYTPGSNDWDFKRAVGVTVSKLSDTARVNLRNKNMNMYTRVGGVNIFQDGNMFDGSPIDEIIGIDWLYARLQEGIYFRLINSLKIPMTNVGLVIIENEIRSVLSQAEANGLIDRGWSCTTPDVLDIPENMRAARTAGVFKFNARLAGSIRKIQITGFLSV